MRSGEAVLRSLGFGGTTLAQPLAAQARILLFMWWTTFCILRASKPRFQPLLPPTTTGSVQSASLC